MPWPTRPPTDSRSTPGARISTATRFAAVSASASRGRDRHDVEEYSVSEGWIRVQAGKTMDRHGRPLTIRLTGEVEPYFTDGAGEDQSGEGAESPAEG
jgi:hypothetical protein